MRGGSLEPLQTTSKIIYFKKSFVPTTGGKQRTHNRKTLQTRENFIGEDKTKHNDGSVAVSDILGVYGRVIDFMKFI